MVVRLSRSSVGQEEKDALARVIDAGYLGMGDEVRLFEQEIAQWLGTDLCVICVATGTAALELAISSLDIGAGDEILIPSITYVASFQAASATGAKAVACDVCPTDGFIDLADAERRVTERTRAVMPVHYASSARRLDDVYEFAGKHNLRVIEDAAHAFGCTRRGAKVGSAGDILCFSFDGIKNITAGEGGAIVTGDEEVARRARDGRLLGVERDTEARYSGGRTWHFDVQHQGFRFHMSNLMAAIGRAQLKKLERFSARRREIAARYRRELGALNTIATLDLDWDEIVPHIFVIRVLDGRRNLLAETLNANGVETGFHYQPNHQLSYFSGSGSLPGADSFGDEILTLPLHAELTEAEQGKVIELVKRFFSGPA